MDKLTCDETFRRLDDFVDRELSPEEMELVRQHLEACVICAAEYAFNTSLLVELRSRLRHIDVPQDLLERIGGKLAELRVAGPNSTDPPEACEPS